MSYRDGIRNAKNWPDHIAAVYANYDNEQGRQWRPLGDTATSGPFLYGSPRGYYSERRGVDFYREGELMWLLADAIIREQTHDKASLDTFAREFFGQSNTGPITVGYDRADVIAGLNKVAPYDWAGFFHRWVDDIAVHPPAAFESEGWKLVYTDQPSHDVEKSDFSYSLGFDSGKGNVVTDVHFGSAAWKAGLGFGQRLAAVNGREYSDDLLYDAVKEAQRSHRPIQLLVEKDEMYRTISIPYFDGPRYPHLERVKNTADILTDVVKPLRKE